MLNRILAAAFLLVGLCAINFAQSIPEKTPETANGGLALEITFLKTSPPAYMPIDMTGERGGGAWYALFGRVADFRLPPNGLPVRAVNIVPKFEKDQVKIAISVFQGQRFQDREEKVAVYSIRENERITVKELLDFGVEPFQIALVRVAPTATALPTVINQTNSLQITSLEPIYSPLPAYKVNFLNTSDKDVLALTFETRDNNGRRLISSMPQGIEGAALIKSGRIYQNRIPNSLQNIKTADGQPPPIRPNQTFVLLMVVFADGSYEGDALDAAQFLAFNLGRKIQLRQMTNFSVETLEKQLANFKFTIDEGAFADLLKDFPMLNDQEKRNLRMAVETGGNGVRVKFAKAVEQVKNESPDELRAWLTKANEIHRQWLARL